MSAENVNTAKKALQDWSAIVRKELSPSNIYCFGSLLYQDGSKFTAESDIDLLIVMPELPDAIERVEWIEQILGHKVRLEDELGKALGRSNRSEFICSVVAVTSLEISADIHKGGAPSFFSSNQFWNLETGESKKGIAEAGTINIAERLVGECVKFVQTTRNGYLKVNALGHESLGPFDDRNDAAPKQTMRHAAMLRFLEDDGDGDPGAEYDVDIGADRITILLDDRRGQLKELAARYGSRRKGRAEAATLTSKEQLLLAELIFDKAVQLEASAEAKATAPDKPTMNGAHSTVMFGARFDSAFPGVRGIKWFEETGAVRMHLAHLLREPLQFEDGTPFWWTRGGGTSKSRVTRKPMGLSL